MTYHWNHIWFVRNHCECFYEFWLSHSTEFCEICRHILFALIFSVVFNCILFGLQQQILWPSQIYGGRAHIFSDTLTLAHIHSHMYIGTGHIQEMRSQFTEAGNVLLAYCNGSCAFGLLECFMGFRLIITHSRSRAHATWQIRFVAQGLKDAVAIVWQANERES